MSDMMNKFSFAQMTSNSDGKTSGSGTVGIIVALAGVVGFIYGVVEYACLSKDGTIMSQSIIVITIGAGLLGFRKSKDGNLAAVLNTADNDTTTITTTEVKADDVVK